MKKSKKQKSAVVDGSAAAKSSGVDVKSHTTDTTKAYTGYNESEGPGGADGRSFTADNVAKGLRERLEQHNKDRKETKTKLVSSYTKVKSVEMSSKRGQTENWKIHSQRKAIACKVHWTPCARAKGVSRDCPENKDRARH